MRKTKKYVLLKAIFRYSLRNFVKLKNMKIVYKVLSKLQAVNKLVVYNSATWEIPLTIQEKKYHQFLCIPIFNNF